MSVIKDLQFSLRKRLPVIVQTEASECGLACLAMISSFHGYQADLSELRKRFLISLKGTSLGQLIEIADQLKLASRALRLEMDELCHVQTPAVLHWNLNHFVVLKSVRGDTAYLHDPASGDVRLPLAEVSRHFTGVALELTPGLDFQRKNAPPPIQLRQLFGRVTGLKRGLVQIFGLALVLEMFAVVSPILTQWITDEAIVSGDRDLGTILCLGMVLIGLASAVIGGVRTWAGIYISVIFNQQWMSNVMGRLLKLPVEYFERRHLGDIVSRFDAVNTIQHGMTSAIIDVVLDGLLAIGTLVMMFLYSAKLSMVTLSSVLLYALLRWLRYDALKAASSGIIAKKAKEQTYFLETIRGVRTIKMSNRANERRASWLNLWVDSTNASLVIQKLNLVFSSSWSFISVLERAAVFWLGAHAVIDSRMSVGMLFAYITYKEQFSGRVNGLIDRAVEFSMLSISVERLADIVLSEPEEQPSYQRRETPRDLTLTFENVSFKYAGGEQPILHGATMTIRPGECVALVGPSGTGKTTCLKLLLGILQPNLGKIQLGGLTIPEIGLNAYRNIVSTVMQDDHLFAGSVFDNICFMDPTPDQAWLIECAKAACIHDEIIEMTMGYHSLVGDMGTVLSGGQKQRVLLARALYRRPQILVLDEATSHLDVQNEKKIGAAVAALKITRILIAHRPQTIAIADRVLMLENGKFVELVPQSKAA